AIVQPLVQQHEAIRFPQKGLQPVAALAAEEKQAAGIRINFEALLYEGNQTVQPLSHIRIAADDVDVSGLSDVPQHLRPAPLPGRPDSRPVYPWEDECGYCPFGSRCFLRKPPARPFPEPSLCPDGKIVPPVP